MKTHRLLQRFGEWVNKWNWMLIVFWFVFALTMVPILTCVVLVLAGSAE